MGREFGRELAEWFRFEVSHWVAAKTLARAAVICALDRLEALLPRWVTNVAGELGLAVGRTPQFLTVCPSPEGPFRVLRSWLRSSRVSNPRESRAEAAMSSTTSSQKSDAITSRTFCGLHRTPYSAWEEV